MDSKTRKIAGFNPNDVGVNNGQLYGLPFTADESEIIVIPVPWDVTVSYGEGTADGPNAVLEASTQVDYYLPEFPNTWKRGIFMTDIPKNIYEQGKNLRKDAIAYIDFLENGGKLHDDPSHQKTVDTINQACGELHSWVQEEAEKWMDKGKKVVVLGGDHSSPLGLMKALANKHKEFGVLTLDAHADLRKAYEGFRYSHASIFFNALEEIPQITKMVQAGIRDFCEEEADYASNSAGRVTIFTEEMIRKQLFQGKTQKDVYGELIASLPQHVYVSVDIDGLNPNLCPNTGTPVPGGFEFYEALFLIDQLKASGKTIIGLDLCEVAPGEDDWDANVGARLLYQLCARI